MASFSIGFTGFDREDPLVAVGVLKLGAQHEYFESVLGFWEKLPHEFDPAAPWQCIRPRSVVDEDGDRISEWRVSIDDIGEFLGSSA
jgi:hypothetical protein